MPEDNRHLAPEDKAKLLRLLRESFERQVRKIRIEQYRLMTEMIKRLDREKAEKLLQSLTK